MTAATGVRCERYSDRTLSERRILDETYFPVCIGRVAVCNVGKAQQYPMMDMVANKVIQKYQSSTCEQLWQEKAKKTPPHSRSRSHPDAEERPANADCVS